MTALAPSRAPFAAALAAAWQRTDGFLCVGLDPDPARMPEPLRERPVADAVFEFCRAIVAATADSVCAFKPQAAHFAALGFEDVLADLIAHIHSAHPGIPVILDAKRGDIGSTAEYYAREAFERYDADAVTVNPLLGQEGLAPFLARTDRGTIVLCRTSNPDSAWLQDANDAAEPAYLRIARAAPAWNQAGNLMLVAGATYPEELARIRAAAPDVGLLVPGVGAQGGDLESVYRCGADRAGFGLAVNASRSVLYASAGEAFANAAAAVARDMLDQMRALRAGDNRIEH